MLVMTRRLNDRVVFPALGISIELIRASKSRAQLGIFAPKGIRVLRHELLENDANLPTDGELEATVRRELAGQIQDRIDQATDRVFAAQQKLKAGQTTEALRELSVAIGELDELRVADGGAQTARNLPREAMPSELQTANSVGEAAANYACDNAKTKHDGVRFVLVENADCDSELEAPTVRADFEKVGLDYSVATNSFELYCALSRADAVSTVVFAPEVTPAEVSAMVEMIREGTRQDSVRICATSQPELHRLDVEIVSDWRRFADHLQDSDQESTRSGKHFD
ncbi:MAG: carbon storage regulator [Planctomycetota bacterium]